MEKDTNLLNKVDDFTVFKLAIQTTKELLKNQDKLKIIKWNDGEANIDTEYSKLSCQCCIMAWKQLKILYQEFKDVTIECTIPDINITFKFVNNTELKKKIELKSSKSVKMLGSTIKKLDINQPLIYCLRPTDIDGVYNFKCSQYYSAMGESNLELFQDRTPRPIINFEKMPDINENITYVNKNKNSWINHYAYCAINRIDNSIKCQYSWQDEMVKLMEQIIIKKYLTSKTIEEIKIDKDKYQF